MASLTVVVAWAVSLCLGALALSVAERRGWVRGLPWLWLAWLVLAVGALA